MLIMSYANHVVVLNNDPVRIIIMWGHDRVLHFFLEQRIRSHFSLVLKLGIIIVTAGLICKY